MRGQHPVAEIVVGVRSGVAAGVLHGGELVVVAIPILFRRSVVDRLLLRSTGRIVLPGRCPAGVANLPL